MKTAKIISLNIKTTNETLDIPVICKKGEADSYEVTKEGAVEFTVRKVSSADEILDLVLSFLDKEHGEVSYRLAFEWSVQCVEHIMKEIK